MQRIMRVYGVEPAMTEACLGLSKEKIKDPDKISSSERVKIFGEDADLVNTALVQEELALDENGNGTGNGNGTAKAIRRGGQIDLAFLKSHEFSVLLDRGDPTEHIGQPPFTVKATGEGAGEPFVTESVLELHHYLGGLGEKGVSVQRYKGLGEMNADQLKETTMDPEKRTMLRVDAEDEANASRMFELLMGDQVDPRKEFIQSHAADVRNLDI